MQVIVVAVVGALVTAAVGHVVVRRVLNSVEASMLRPWGGILPAPSWVEQPVWDDSWKRQGGGPYVGFVEQIIIFASFWADGGWPLLASWLAFKVACQWESWKHSSGLVDLAKERPAATAADLLAIQRWVAIRYVTFLVGTGANIVIALAVAAVARAIAQSLSPGFAV